MVVTPVAISLMLRTEQGATIMPTVLKLPLAMGAPISPMRIAMIRLGRHLFGREFGFIADGHFRRLGHHQMRFDLQARAKASSKPDAIGNARSARKPDHQPVADAALTACFCVPPCHGAFLNTGGIGGEKGFRCLFGVTGPLMVV